MGRVGRIRMNFRNIFAVLCLVVFSAVLCADTLTLKDGSTVDGKVIQQGEKYWVKLADGTTKYVAKSEVTNWTKAEAGKAPAVSAPVGTPIAPKGAPDASAAAQSVSFAAVKAKAEGVDSPVLAVQVWQKFVDSKPPAEELAAANAELAKWQQLQKDNAERINGKWVGGAERKELLKKVEELVKDGTKALT